MQLLILSGVIDIGGDAEKPAVLEKTGVVRQDLALKRSLYARHSQLGTVTDLQWGNFIPEAGKELAVVSDTGAIFLDGEAKTLRATRLDLFANNVALIEFGPEKIPHFMSRGGWIEAPELLDLDGKTLWTLNGGMSGVDDMCAGDLDGDGFTDFAVGFNGGGGIRLYDEKGKQRWKKSGGNIWHVEIVDYDGQGSMGIVHSNAGGELTLRDGKGTILSQVKPAGYFSGFSQCRWPGAGSKAHLLSTENNAHWILDCKGTVVAELPAPGSGDFSTSFGTAVQFKKDDTPHFAVLTDYDSLWKASVLWVYDNEGVLVYQEILQGRGAAVLAIRDEKTGTDRLLVGGKGRVLAYTLATTPDSS